MEIGLLTYYYSISYLDLPKHLCIMESLHLPKRLEMLRKSLCLISEGFHLAAKHICSVLKEGL